MNDLDWMTRAWQLALKGKGRTSPNPLVGAVIVKNGQLIAEGWHARCGGPHAEIVALKKAGPRAAGAVLYVTLEPCRHFGRTPPCLDAIIAAGIKRAVVGMKDPNPAMNGRSLVKLRRAGIAVTCGILEDELFKMNEAFIKYIKFHRPLVVAKSAQTLDGKIAVFSGRSRWITSSPTRQWARQRRNEFDGILVGIETVLKDDPRLNPADRTKSWKKVVVDSRLRIPLNARLFRATSPQDCLIATTRAYSLSKYRQLLKKNVTVIVCPQRGKRVDLGWLMEELARREITSVLIEGGAHVIGSALAQKLVDRMHIYVAPWIMGDERALGAVAGLDDGHTGKVALKDIQIQKIGKDILIEGSVQY